MSLSALDHLKQLGQLGPVGEWALDQIIALTVEKIGLQKQLRSAQASLDAMEEQVEEWKRKAHRQAAPFRRDPNQRNPNPGRSGRKKGHRGHFRPKPDHINERVHIPLEACPHCQGQLCDKRPLVQYIEEIPQVRPVVTELTTEEGWCKNCQCDVYSTHPLQTSRAGGAAATQLGPRSLALAIDLNKAKGLSMRKTVEILRDYFGLKLTPGGLALAVQRAGKKVAPQYEQMPMTLRQSAVVHADETGWWVNGPKWWLWVFATEEMTYYIVIQSRAREVVTNVLGSHFAGTLVSDCLSIYDDVNDQQQKCYSHHLKAISEACQAHPQQGQGYLQQVQALLRTALLLKAFQEPTPDPRFELCLQNLKQKTWPLLHGSRDQPQEEKVRQRLYKQRDHLFTFLKKPEVPATNNLGERQLRPAVIARKISCGNKTPKGALAWSRLTSVAATCQQTRRSFIDVLILAFSLPPPRAP
jgi:hypothetical protein